MVCQIQVLALLAQSLTPTYTYMSAYTHDDTDGDKAKLERATQYFQSGKYHEALLLFQPLMHKYALNQRTIAYIGVCCYYERDYKMAIQCFAQAESTFTAFAPQERSVYYYCYAESLMQQKAYTEALPLYGQYTLICHPEEKSDALFKMAVCNFRICQWQQALDYIALATENNNRYGTLGKGKEQKMTDMKGECEEHLHNGTPFAE